MCERARPRVKKETALYFSTASVHVGLTAFATIQSLRPDAWTPEWLFCKQPFSEEAPLGTTRLIIIISSRPRFSS